ncbi:MAG: DUF4335 domain-containing protein [Cyanobacteria bacterium P01_D01_bin.105]
MTIRRQYQLPNCSLVLDGLSIDPEPGSEDVMSLLVNAECRISGLERSLNGGYSFFAALVRAVSQYSQEILSGFAHPQVAEGEPLLVHINPGDGPYHHLVVQPEIADLGESGDGRAIDIKLSSVQLFDLTEAVDQFFDDTQTLPELETALSPLPRRFVRTEEPLSDRALPAILGAGSLVVATMAFGLLPVPELRDPANDNVFGDSSAEVASVDAEGSEPPSGDDAESSETVSSAEDTAAVNPVATDAEANPDATEPSTIATSGSDEDGEAIANPDSEVVQAAASSASADFDDTPPAAVRSLSAIERLNQQLKQTVVDNRDQPRVGKAAATYRVRLKDDGTIIAYQPINAGAAEAVDETPLPKLLESAPDEVSSVDYRVVFTERGVVEVSPWWGWSYYD